MPRDAKGGFHLNFQRMHAAERTAKPGGGKPGGATPKSMEPKSGAPPAEDAGEHQSVGSVTVHDHGDGTMHTEHADGSVVEHPHVGHMATHLAAHHEPDGKHMHIHQDAMGQHTTHHAGPGGEVEGPHDHANLDALKQHMDQFLGEEEGEGGGEGGGEWGKHDGMDGVAGI